MAEYTFADLHGERCSAGPIDLLNQVTFSPRVISSCVVLRYFSVRAVL